jgi:hypothetical protein
LLGENVARTGEMGNKRTKIVQIKKEPISFPAKMFLDRDHLGKSKLRREDRIKMNYTEIGSGEANHRASCVTVAL